jgi:hypothetical protein
MASGRRTSEAADRQLVSELTPVRLRRSRIDGAARLLAMFLLGGLVVAIIKPWGAGPSAGRPGTSPLASAVATGPSPTEDVVGFSGLDYDPAIFGSHEPEATWAIWPAGYLVTFGFVIQLSGDASPTPGAGRPTGNPSASAQPLGPSWPARFDVPEGNHLFLIGVNMPKGFVLASHELLRAGPDRTYTTIPSAELNSPWPSHFAVLGIRDPLSYSGTRLIVWPAGDYRLQLTFEPGGITRSMDIRIAAPPIPSPSIPSPTSH